MKFYNCHHANGGHGTGEDITAYALESWIVTPGAGGNKYHDLFGYYGGGGGGVLVGKSNS